MLFSMHSLLTTLFLLFTLVAARDSAEVKSLRKHTADEADKHITFITHPQLDAQLHLGTWIIFYGANWCKFTQKFTPHYLAVQDHITQLNINMNNTVFHMRKVECSVDEQYCTQRQGVSGFPTVNLYRDGVKIEEYPHADEEAEFFEYVKVVIDNLVLTGGKGNVISSNRTTSAVVTEVPVEKSGLIAPTQEEETSGNVQSANGSAFTILFVVLLLGGFGYFGYKTYMKRAYGYLRVRA